MALNIKRTKKPKSMVKSDAQTAHEEGPPWEETKAAVKTATEVKHSKTGAVVSKESVEKMVVVPPVYANVGIQAQRTINLGEYNSVKLGVSIHHPCEPNPEAIEETYQFCMGWVDEKMKALTEEHDGEPGDAD
jgi:hypothetical protein